MVCIKKLAKLLVFTIYLTLTITLLLEAALRIYPKLISPRVLLNFNEELRADIAKRVGLQSKHDVVELQRDDGGPLLTINKPFTTINFNYKDEGSINSQTTDEMGFCNLAGSYEKKSFDIITIGDSLTWCTTIRPEDSWTKVLSRATGFSAYNLGRGGVGLYEYVQILKSFGLRKSPKIVIMGVTESNDLRDALRFYTFKEWQDSNKNLQWPPQRNCKNPICRARQTFEKSSLGKHSYALNLFIATLKVTASKTIYARQNTIDTNFRYALNFKKHSIPFNKDNVDVDEIVHARKLLSGEISTDLFSRALSDFTAISKEYDFIPVVIYLPSAHTAYSQYVTFENKELENVMPKFSEIQLSYVKSMSSKMGYIFIDTTDMLKRSSASHTMRENLLYYPTNLHLTKYGHEVVGNHLTNVLRDLKILPLSSDFRPKVIQYPPS